MQGIALLFEKNTGISSIKLQIKKGKIIILFNKQVIDGRGIQQIIKIVNTIEKKYPHSQIPLVINLGNVIFADKLTMVIFECICFYVIKFCKRVLYLQYHIIKKDIWTEGIRSTPFLLLGKHDHDHVNRFLQQFKFEVYSHHFRKIITPSKDNLELSKLMTEVEVFLKLFGVEENYKDKISEVIVELVGNAGEHTKTQSLLDIDVTFPYTNKNTGNIVYGINIVILNFSTQLFGTALKEKLHSNSLDVANSRYEKVLSAYSNHEKQFDDCYTEEDFYNIASFQHKISGRENVMSYGGTGLTKLIESLENMSDAHKCYMLTGNRAVNFIGEHLIYDSDNWISFNGSKNFQDNIPNNQVIDGCPIYFPGTAYNLNFVMRKVENNEK